MNKLKHYKPFILFVLLTIIYSCSKDSDDMESNSEDSQNNEVTNDNTLIDINNLNQLNAVRYDLNGDGVPDDSENAEKYYSVFPDLDPSKNTISENYKGFELRRNLNFRNSESYLNNSIESKFVEFLGWEPIGIRGLDNELLLNKQFNAYFNGNNFSIKNLFIDRPSDVGIFGYINNSNISNLKLEDVNIKSDGTYGALSANAFSSNISNCNVTGKFSTRVFGIETYIEEQLGATGLASRGGLIGFGVGVIITNSFVSLTATSFLDGGIVGRLTNYPDGNRITECSTRGNLYSGGGILGGTFNVSGKENVKVLIENCYSECNILGYGGGLVKIAEKLFEIRNCYANGNIGEGGGLVAQNYQGRIISCYATGDVGSESTPKRVKAHDGGLVGVNTGIIENCWSSGNIYTRNSDIGTGGLVGKMGTTRCCIDSPSDPSIINNSYSVGNIIGTGENLGVLVGFAEESQITNSYALGTSSNSNTNETNGLIGGLGNNVLFNALITTKKDLQNTTTASGIFSLWDSSIWDFGTADEYPGLKNTTNNNTISRPN